MKVVIMKRKINQCVYLAGLRVQLSSFHKDIILIWPSGHNSQVPRKRVSEVSQLSKNSSRAHCTFPWEKRPRGVFCSVYYHTYCYPNQWNSSVRRVPAVSGKEPVSFRKLKHLTKIVVVMRRKMNRCVFLASLRLQLSTFQRRKILILPLGYIFQYPKKVFPCTFRAV